MLWNKQLNVINHVCNMKISQSKTAIFISWLKPSLIVSDMVGSDINIACTTIMRSIGLHMRKIDWEVAKS